MPNHPFSTSLTTSASAGLADWLRSRNIALAFTTYRANRLLFLGTNAGEPAQLKLHERLFDRPMGLFVDGESLWMAARCQLWRLDNLLAPDQLHEGGDRLYVPAASFTTGDVNAHEIVVGGDGQPIFVNTAFSCLATIKPRCSFAPTWAPPFITQLAGDDRCHLNGIALKDGLPTWATACGGSGDPSSWRNQRSGGGVVIHIPSGELAASGLTMPHSPRWHNGRLWLLNSGTGELGWIEQERFRPLIALPGFVRGLAFADGCALVGLSKLRSPQFTGLPLEQRLQADGNPGGCCGIRVIDLATREIVHSLDLAEPIDELFDVAVLPGVRQPRALGLVGDAINSLVKLPQQNNLVRIKPSMPNTTTHQGPAVERVGLSRSTATQVHSTDSLSKRGPIHYQRVFQLTEATLAPYADLTYPSLAPGSTAWRKIKGELLGISASQNGNLVGLALAECRPDRTARLVSIFISPPLRRQGIGTGLLVHLSTLLQKQRLTSISVRYQAPNHQPSPLDRILPRLGWSIPLQTFLLLKGEAEQLASINWLERFPLPETYQLVPWRADFAANAEKLQVEDDLIRAIQSSQLEAQASTALIHHDTLVGWVLVDRTSANATRISSLFVEKGHRARGQGLSLLTTAFRKQHAAGIPIARAAVAPHSQAMLRLVNRHLGRHLKSITSARSSQLNLESNELQKR